MQLRRPRISTICNLQSGKPGRLEYNSITGWKADGRALWCLRAEDEIEFILPPLFWFCRIQALKGLDDAPPIFIREELFKTLLVVLNLRLHAC
jgi:hypothetical protein